jgi:hypothetical protein
VTDRDSIRRSKSWFRISGWLTVAFIAHTVLFDFNRLRLLRKRFNHDFVDETPSPILARFKRSHDGMFCLSEVLGGVLVLRGIAAADVAADLAKAQMNPRIAHLQALLAPIALRGWAFYLVQV